MAFHKVPIGSLRIERAMGVEMNLGLPDQLIVNLVSYSFYCILFIAHFCKVPFRISFRKVR